MLMPSIKRANSASVSSGMTMSSFILKALVRRAMAPSFLRSAQKRLASAASCATKISVLGCCSSRVRTRSTPRIGLLSGVSGDVDEQRSFWRLCARSFHLVVDGANILVVKMFKRQQRFGAVGREGKDAREFEDDAAGLVEVRPEELQAEGLLRRVLGIENEDRRGDDAVGAFLLQPGHTAQRLVGDVLPEPVLADLGAAQFDVFDQNPLLVQHIEDHRVLRQNFA